jgi:hypothetical protein
VLSGEELVHLKTGTINFHNAIFLAGSKAVNAIRKFYRINFWVEAIYVKGDPKFAVAVIAKTL